MSIVGFLKRIYKPVEEKLESRRAYKDLAERSKADRDYYLLLALSAVIATFGLFLNSVAVIIGAMLIAPLMSPILASGLAIARGDFHFLKKVLVTIAFGVFASVAASVVVAFIVPQMPLKSEILSRTKPNIFDLGVAFFSGVAGAYAFSSKELNESLPGVAIAAALIPPLSVIGVGLGYGERFVVLGGLLLFTANFIAIALGSSITFILLGFYPKRADESTDERKRVGSLIVSVVLIIIVLVPMTYFTVTTIGTSIRINYVEKIIEENLPPWQGYYIDSIKCFDKNGRQNIVVLLHGKEEPDEDRLEFIEDKLQNKYDGDFDLQVNFISYETLE